MRIRPASPDDVPAVLPMVAAICALHEGLDPSRYAMLPDVAARYERWLPIRATDPRSVFLVAEDPAVLLSPGAPSDPARDAPPAITGFLVGSVEKSIPIYRLGEFGFIHDMWVEPAARRSGIGRALVDEAVRRFAAMGITQVRLETAAANGAARRLFEACGFRVCTIDMLRDTGA